MCGRFAASASTDEIVETFAIDEVVDTLTPTWNASPTDPVPAVLERIDKTSGVVRRKLVTPRWGLVPSWSKDPGAGARMINARSETVATKPAFAKAFATRRCLVPADGFYEWEAFPVASGRTIKQPWFVRPADGGLLVMAGLYEFWKDPHLQGDGAWLTTCTIITTTATDAVGRVHDRMPMVVRREDWPAWLDPHCADPASAQALLSVLSGDDIDVFPVSRDVNSVRNDGPHLVDEVEQVDRGDQAAPDAGSRGSVSGS